MVGITIDYEIDDQTGQLFLSLIKYGEEHEDAFMPFKFLLVFDIHMMAIL